jgi:hypothetical protein
MPWFGKYYYRSVRVNGQPRRIYIGPGHKGQQAAEADQRAREQRARDRAAAKTLQTEYASVDADLEEVGELAHALSHAAMYAAGYQLHCRGEWRRRKRECN